MLTSAGRVHPRFEDDWDRLPRWDRVDRRALGRQRFRPPESAVVTEQTPGPVRVIPYLGRLDVWVGRAAPAVTGGGLQKSEGHRS